MKRRIVCLILTALLILGVFAACAKNEEIVCTADGATETPSASKSGGSMTKDEALDEGIPGEEAAEDVDVSIEADMELYTDMTVSESLSSSDGVSEGAEIPQNSDIEAGTLTAGEWKDNDNYDFWRSLFERDEWRSLADKWKMIPDMRFAVTLTNGQNAAKNVRVEMYAGEHLLASAVSDSYGKAYLNPHLSSWYDEYILADLVAADRLVVYFDGKEHEYPISADDLAAGGMTVTDAKGEKYAALDLMFVIDTTGSMGDELEYLKKELDNVISTVAEENDGLDIALSLNFYRDEGDEYVVKSNPFTSDIEAALKLLDNEYSDGGGDYPEAVHTALEDALNGHEWREDSVKLMFLVLDAPPHGESEEVIESIRTLIVKAAEMGVRIIPVASSGVDTETEFLLRMMAAASGGSYTFLTDHSGVGESHLEPTIGDYDVKKLNDLLVKIINEYCK